MQPQKSAKEQNLPIRTRDDLRRLRNELTDASGLAIGPKELRANDEFFVVEFATAGITVVRSGVFYGTAADKRQPYLLVHLDGDPGRRHFTPAQLGFYPKGSSPYVIVRTLRGIMFDLDARTEAERNAWLARQSCPCGTVRGDGSRCPEWPDCVIP